MSICGVICELLLVEDVSVTRSVGAFDVSS